MRTRYRLMLKLLLLLLLLVGAGVLAWPTCAVGQAADQAVVHAIRVRLQADLGNYPYTDSLTAALYEQGRWRSLASVGRLALRAGTDYPALRRRLGEAAARTDQPAAALLHYGRALRADPLDTVARYGLAAAHRESGQVEAATLVARHLSATDRQALRLRRYGAVQRAEAEVSGQTTTSSFRSNAGFARLGLSSQLSPRLWLTQSVARYGQTVELPEVRPGTTYAVRQWEYHGLLTAQISARWQAQVGYSYLDSRFGSTAYPGHLAYGAVAYAHPYGTVQVGHYAGRLTDSARTQTDLRLTVYPRGNLSFYSFGRLSRVVSGGHSFLNGLLGAGIRVRPWCWVEVFGSAGHVPVLADADGTYVYNLLDAQQRRGGAGAYFVLPHHLGLRLHYTAEARARALSRAEYSIYGLTTALVWTW